MAQTDPRNDLKSGTSVEAGYPDRRSRPSTGAVVRPVFAGTLGHPRWQRHPLTCPMKR